MTKKELIKERKIYRKEMRKLIGDLCLVSTADKDAYETKQKIYLIKSLGGKLLFLNKEIKKKSILRIKIESKKYYYKIIWSGGALDALLFFLSQNKQAFL